MSSTTEKLRGLVEALYLRTEQAKLDWQISEDNEIVWTLVGAHRIELAEEQSGRFQTDVRVTVYNDKGDQVDTFADSYFGNLTPVTVQLGGYFALLSTLLEMARRQATGADAAIASILDTLGGSPITDPPPPNQFVADELEDDVPF